MRFTVFVDTSAWYALTDTDDARHAQAVNALRQLQASGNRLVTTNHVIGESYTLVLSRLGRRVAQTFLAGMSASRLVERVFVLEAWEQAAESLIFRYLDQSLSFVDATSFVTMRRRGIERAFAYDHHFQVAGFSLT